MPVQRGVCVTRGRHLVQSGEQSRFLSTNARLRKIKPSTSKFISYWEKLALK